MLETKNGNVCLADNITTHTILQDQKYFLEIKYLEGKVNTIFGLANFIKGSRRAIPLLASEKKKAND